MSHDPENSRAADFLNGAEEMLRLEGGTGEHPIRDALKDAVAMLSALQMDFVLFGALAVAAHVPERRTTRDVDIVTSDEGAARIPQVASEYGFSKLSGPDGGRGAMSFRHREGAVLDMICSSTGFADIQKASMVDFPGVGKIPVAVPEDLIWAKLRTQSVHWERDPQKRLTDRSDIIALLRSNPRAFSEVQRRFTGDRLLLNHQMSEMARALEEIGREASVNELASALPGFRSDARTWLLMAGLVILFAVLLGAAILAIKLLWPG